jgi:hypothetical protein
MPARRRTAPVSRETKQERIARVRTGFHPVKLIFTRFFGRRA